MTLLPPGRYELATCELDVVTVTVLDGRDRHMVRCEMRLRGSPHLIVGSANGLDVRRAIGSAFCHALQLSIAKRREDEDGNPAT